MMQTLNVGLIGYKFMGKAHSHALKDVGMFFDLPVKPVMKVICGRDEAGVLRRPNSTVGRSSPPPGRSW